MTFYRGTPAIRAALFKQKLSAHPHVHPTKIRNKPDEPDNDGIAVELLPG